MKKFLKRVVIRDDYMTRWHLIPRNKVCNVYLHRFCGSDHPVFHDHPWWSVSFLLRGCLFEQWRTAGGQYKDQRIPWLFPIFRRAELMHRLDVCKAPVWTLFVTGPVVRRWGFAGRDGRWVDHEVYLADEVRAAGLQEDAAE